MSAAGLQVDVFIASYALSPGGVEPGGHGQGVVSPDGRWSWLGEGPRFAGGESAYLKADNGEGRLAVTYFRYGDMLTGSRLRLKLAIMRDRLLFRLKPAAMMIVSTRDEPGKDAARSLGTFLDAAGSASAWMDRTEERP